MIARRTARLALSTGHWSDTLPTLAVLEDAAVDAMLGWLRDVSPDVDLAAAAEA